MVGRSCYFRPIITLCIASLASSKRQFPGRNRRPASEEFQPRRLEIHGLTNSDEFAQAVLTATVPRSFGLGLNDHAKITSILSTTKEMIDTARVLVQNQETVGEGRAIMERANALFREVKEKIIAGQREARKSGEDDRELLRKKYASHNVEQVQEDDSRTLDVARRIYETMVTFPECLERLFDDCLAIINGELGDIGLSTIEVVVHEKRNQAQEGYNKVVIITNELGDRVTGKLGDGIVNYPFLWHDSLSGVRTLGVDGKWNCHDLAPEDCCQSIKTGVPNKDTQGNQIECHIFVPFGGIDNPRRNDRVFINLSPDGRVHEPPVIQ